MQAAVAAEWQREVSKPSAQAGCAVGEAASTLCCPATSVHALNDANVPCCRTTRLTPCCYLPQLPGGHGIECKALCCLGLLILLLLLY